MRAWAGEDVLIGEVLLPVDGRRAAEIVHVVKLAIPRDADAIGDRVARMIPVLGATRQVGFVREVIASVAEVAGGVVDPRTAVLSGSAAFEGDAHRRVDVGGVDLVANGASAAFVIEMGER